MIYQGNYPPSLSLIHTSFQQYEALGVKGLLVEFETIKTLELIFDIWYIVQFRYNIVPFDTKAHELNTSKNRYKGKKIYFIFDL